MGNFISNILKERKRRQRISDSNRRFYQEHGVSRKVVVKEMGKEVGFIFLERRNGTR